MLLSNFVVFELNLVVTAIIVNGDAHSVCK